MYHYQATTCSIPGKGEVPTDAPLDLVHGDLCGTITLGTLARRCFFLLLVDDTTDTCG
jgi:hypothetical protein